MIKKSISWVVIISLLILSNFMPAPPNAYAKTDLTLLVDGQDITSLSAPVIVNDRTLVPVRFVSESLGADVEWDGEAYTVTITRNDRVIFLTIGSRLVEYDNGASCIISDVAPMIINDRTYVPIRLISNAFGIGISWDGETRTVSVDSSEISEVEALYDFNITSISHGDMITGVTEIKFEAGETLRGNASKAELIMFEKGSTQGLVIERKSAGVQSFEYIPSPDDNGEKTLAVAFYDEDNNFVAGAAVSVEINVVPEIEITGAQSMTLYRDTISLGVETNFPIYAVKYDIINKHSGRKRNTGKINPLSSYSWTPVAEENGICYITATVYDKTGNSYISNELPVIISVNRSISLSGVSEGMHIDKPVYLIASRNFDVDETSYLIRDNDSRVITEITTVPYGGYSWFPGPEYAGEKDLAVRVLDTRGMYHISDFVSVTISEIPQFIFSGLGPGQMLTSSATLTVKGNITPDTVRYKLTDLDTGTSRYLENTSTYTPQRSDEGSMRIQAEAVYKGKTYTMPSIDFNVYLDQIYGPIPVVPQEDFLTYAAKMAVESMHSTGMSAALQTAQAILETGWGQSVPVDKYTGQFSHNLFGIKGSGTAGSVISNTWEVYNGVSFRVDDYFRAYYSEEEAWADHKNFLLTQSRYKPFIEVMHDCAKGAAALKQAGYATDPLYAIKLLDIINRYNLWELDLKGL